MRVTKKWKVVLIILGVVLLYILAEGPAYRLLCKEVIPQPVFTAVYYPVIWSCRHSRFIDDAFHSYEGLWYDDLQIFKDEGLLK
jgi:hypothetical protein